MEPKIGEPASRANGKPAVMWRKLGVKWQCDQAADGSGSGCRRYIGLSRRVDPRGVTTITRPGSASWRCVSCSYDARSGDEAIAKAEREARSYAREWDHRNRYGQRVRCRYLGYCNAYELFEVPDASVEVFSATEVVGRDVPDDEIIDRLIGTQSMENELALRASLY